MTSQFWSAFFLCLKMIVTTPVFGTASDEPIIACLEFFAGSQEYCNGPESAYDLVWFDSCKPRCGGFK